MNLSTFGVVDRRGSSRTLLLDFDGEGPDWGRIYNVARRHRLKPVAMELYRTRHGWHVVVFTRRRVEPWQALVLQALMGSDWRRESLNLLRLWDTAGQVQRGLKWRWNVLYNGKTA
jgi:hypothetical protein